MGLLAASHEWEQKKESASIYDGVSALLIIALYEIKPCFVSKVEEVGEIDCIFKY